MNKFKDKPKSGQNGKALCLSAPEESVVEVNDRGQIVIPKPVRAMLRLKKHSRLKMVVKKSGVMELQKIVEIPVDYSLENDPVLREKVMKAFQSVKEGRVGNAEDLKRKLFGDEEF